MGTSVLVSISVLLSGAQALSHAFIYHKNSIVGRLEGKDRVIRESFTLHLNPWTTRVYLNTVPWIGIELQDWCRQR